MSDAAAAPAPKVKTPKKKTSKPKTPANHPKYSQMVKAAIAALKERGGSSRQAILNYILKTYKVAEPKTVNQHLKMALRAGVKNKTLKQSKGTGASGSFRLGDVKEKTEKKPVAKKAKKPKAAKSPKKVKKAKSPKKVKAVKPKTAKPKTKKSPKKAIKPKATKVAKPKTKTAKPKTKKAKSPKKAAKK